MELIAKEMIFRRKVVIWELAVGVVFLGASVYFIFKALAGHWLNVISPLILLGMAFLRPAIELFRTKYCCLKIDNEGIAYQNFVWRRYSWRVDWAEVKHIYWDSRWHQRKMTIIFADDSSKGVESATAWRSNDDKSVTVIDAIAEYSDLLTLGKAPQNHNPAYQELGKAAERVTLVIFMSIVIGLAAGFYLHRFVTLGSGIPLELMLLGAALGMLVAAIYLFMRKAPGQAILALGLFSGGAGAFVMTLLIKTGVIVFGDDRLETFELVEYSEQRQRWQMLKDPAIELSFPGGASWVYKIGEQRQLIVRSGWPSLHLLIPEEVDKLKR